MTRYPEDLAAFLAEKLEAAWRAAPGGEPDSTRAPGAWGYCPICGKYLERLTGHHAKDGRPICVGALPAAEYRGAALGDEPRECRALLDEVVANFHDYIGQTVYGQDWVKRARTTLAASGGKATGTCHECGAPVRENGTWLDLSPRITYAPDGEAP